jgi:hypothetical protein
VWRTRRKKFECFSLDSRRKTTSFQKIPLKYPKTHSMHSIVVEKERERRKERIKMCESPFQIYKCIEKPIQFNSSLDIFSLSDDDGWMEGDYLTL